MNKGKIMRKLLGQHTTTPNGPTDAGVIESSQLRPSASQNTVFETKGAVTCLDRSPDGQRVVVAGQKCFKILKVNGASITTDVDLRSIISSYATSHDSSAATADQFNIRAVKWSYNTLDTTIITACGNGRINLYDLNRPGEGFEYARIQEHARQVHKLAVNPFRCNWLLSASQDGTVKSFDIRAPFVGRNGPTFRTWHTFKCNADAVRDVQWSPTDGMEFACSTDAGIVQKWDVRKPTAPMLKITAHQSACFSIAWHPDGEHLVSGGLDQHCHVWDVSKSAERGQKPRYSFTTPAPVSTVSWRPACWSATAKGKRAAQVTVAYDDTKQNHIAAVHLWDLARIGMPFKEIEHWDSSPAELLWASRDLLWSVDKEGHFTQTDVAFVPKVIDRRSLSTFAFSPNGDVLMFLEERQAPRRARPTLTFPQTSPSYQHNSNEQLLGLSRSDSEEDVVGSFLGPRQLPKRRHRERGNSMSTTPPTNNGINDAKAMSLDEAVEVTGVYKPQQIMAIGHAPSTAKRAKYKYFTNQYLGRLIAMSSTASEQIPMHERVAAAMEDFAKTAERIAHYRLAQTWRLLGYTINLLLVRRAEYHRTSRLMMKRTPPKATPPKALGESYISTTRSRGEETPRNRGEETPRRVSKTVSPIESPLHPVAKSLRTTEMESTSNVATPLVRAVLDSSFQSGGSLPTPPIENDILNLSEPILSASPKSRNPIPVAPGSHSSDYTASSLEGYDFYDIESFTPAIDVAAPVKKTPLRLEYSENHAAPQRIQPVRHDSGESFAMFSTSGDSQSGRFMSSSGSDTHDAYNSTSLRDRVLLWENDPASLQHRSSVDSLAPTMSTDSSGDQLSVNSVPFRLPMTDATHKSVRPPMLRIQEASFQSAAGHLRSSASPDDPISPWTALPSNDPDIIESDYLPWSDDPEFLISPIDPRTLFKRTIEFETQTGALNASAMILFLQPLFSDGTIDSTQAGAILAQYHRRLQSMQLFTEAAMLRNLCVPKYPNIFAMAQENITTGFFCTDCRKPLENDPLVNDSHWRCPRCRKAIDACVICRLRDAADLDYEDEETEHNTLWWYCPGCGHGGHASCMNLWHSSDGEHGKTNSGGCCPLEGCLHPCLPGEWRDARNEEKKAAKQKELDAMVKENARQSRGGRVVRRDAREVTQSSAVEGVRVALGITGLERKRSVKILAPYEG